MPRRSRPASEPDLFSLDRAPPRPAPAAEPRAAASPGAKPATSVDDVGRAIAGWSDDEVERLRVVVASDAWTNPAPDRLWTIARSQTRVWERRPADSDYLSPRIGVASGRGCGGGGTGRG